MNSYVQNLQRDLQFEVDLDLGHTVISVVDRSTNEVIRQIPSEEAVARAQRLQEQLEDTGGLLLKVQA
jgi:flagellar protein FlaG